MLVPFFCTFYDSSSIEAEKHKIMKSIKGLKKWTKKEEKLLTLCGEILQTASPTNKVVPVGNVFNSQSVMLLYFSQPVPKL